MPLINPVDGQSVKEYDTEQTEQINQNTTDILSLLASLSTTNGNVTVLETLLNAMNIKSATGVTSGYFELPSGIAVKWGSTGGTTNSIGDVTLTLNKQLPGEKQFIALPVVLLTERWNATFDYKGVVKEIANNSVTIRVAKLYDGTAYTNYATNFFWLAIGRVGGVD